MMGDRRGQGTLEALFVLMVLILLVFGGLEVAQGVILKHALDVGTEKAARVLAINPSDYATAESIIRDEVTGNLLGHGYGSQVTVRLYDASTVTEITAADLAAQGFGYRFMVGTELVWTPDIPLMNAGDATIVSMHHGVVDRIRP